MLKNALTSLWEGLGLATWIEVTTSKPACTYYFGPFLNEAEAEQHKEGYLADLKAEGAEGIQAVLKQCRKPDCLTVERSEMRV
ncbi:MAG: DUF1816 domain-containing protein [Cyanobacteriota bacterium]|nr:DUF1816 domain-containing protein [Cyanobacteriota bacterium]